MAKKKTNYMSEKRFSLNNLIVGGFLLIGVFFFAVFLYGVNLYSNNSEGSAIINFSKGTDSVADEDILTFYEDKVSETASYLQYGDELYYSVVDINKDGIKDLILKTGNALNGMEYKFYTFDQDAFETTSDSIIYAGSIAANNASLYMNNGDDFATLVGDASYYIYLDNNVITAFQVTITQAMSNNNEIEMHDYQDLRYFE